MKFCINCKHYVLNSVAPTMPELGLCSLAPSSQNLVDGSYEYGHEFGFCSSHRISGCNQSAKFYEEKEVTNV